MLFLSAFLSLSLWSITTKSATFDEVQYFGVGKYLMQNQRWDVMGAILHPPLSYYLNSIPLLFVQEDKRLWEYDVPVRDLDFLGAVDYYRGQELLSSLDNKNDRLLIASRALFTLLSLFTGFYVYRYSTLLYGSNGGLLSLLLFSFCPNMLAYAGLILPDMPLTLYTLATAYHLTISLRDNRISGWILSGLCAGLALLSKFTALLLLPAFMLLTLFFLLRNKGGFNPRLLIVPAVALFTLLIGYGFNLTPYFQGLTYQLAHAADGHSSFLFGQYSISGWWYYYPLVFMLKSPLPLLVIFAASIYLLIRKQLVGWPKQLFLLLPIVLLFTIFSIKHQSIGIRYILPVYPFIFVLAGSLTCLNGLWRPGLYCLLAWYVIGTLYSAPHFLAYFNESVGGSANGYKYLVDSNLDWGQDLKGLKKYMDRNGVQRISLSYFGADSPQRYGINYDWLPSHHLYNPKADEPLQLKQNQLLAISATNLQGVYFDNKAQYYWLFDYQPIAKIGHSIFIYDLNGR